MPKAERKRNAGDDAGKRYGQDEEQRDVVAAEEFGARYGGGGTGAEDEGQKGCDAGHLHGEADGIPDILPFPDDAEPFCGVAGGRELEAFFLGGEGIEEDQQQRHMQKGHAGQGGNFQEQGRAFRAHRRLPFFWQSQDRCP